MSICDWNNNNKTSWKNPPQLQKENLTKFLRVLEGILRVRSLVIIEENMYEHAQNIF